MIVPSVGYRQPEPIKPVASAKVVQEVGQFGPKVLENRMLSDVGQVFISRIGGTNEFAQGCKAILIAMIATTIQRMSHPVWRLCPPPDIALELISQATLGFSASRPVEPSGSNQHGSIPLAPRGSCKNQSTVRKFATDENRKVQELHANARVYKSLHNVCSKSAEVCKKCASSLHYSSSAYLAMTTEKCARRTLL